MNLIERYNEVKKEMIGIYKVDAIIESLKKNNINVLLISQIKIHRLLNDAEDDFYIKKIDLFSVMKTEQQKQISYDVSIAFVNNRRFK